MKKNKSILKKILLICLLVLCISSISMPVFAYTSLDKSGLSGVRKEAYEMALTVYGETSVGPTSEVNEILNFVPLKDGQNRETDSKQLNAMDAIWKYAKSAYTALKTIGASIALLFFLLEVLDKTTREMMTLEHFLIHFMKLIVIIIFLQNGFVILEKLLGVNSEIANTILSATNLTPDVPGTDSETDKLLNNLLTDLKEPGLSGWINSLSTKVSLFVPYLGMLVAKAYILFMCWSRFFEIAIRTAFAPIGMVDIVAEGFKSSNMKYIKKLFAAILQGTIIVVIMEIVGRASAAIALGEGTGMFIYPVILFTEIGMIKKAQSFANDMLGI